MMRDIFEYFRSDKKSIRSMLIFTTASSLLILSIPFLIQTLIQQYTLLIFQPSTVFLILTVSFFLIGITIMRVLQMHLSEFLQRRLFLNAVKDAQELAQKARKSGQPMSKKKWNYIFESISLQKSIIPLFFDGFTFCIQGVLVMALISIYHPFFAIYSLILMLAFYWVTVVMGKKTLEFAHQESTKKHELIHNLQIDDPAPTSQNEIENQIFDYFTIRDKRYSLYLRQSVGLFVIKILAAIVLILVGGLLVFQNQMTIGQLIASELIVTNLLISLFKFSNILDYFYDSATAIKKLKLLQEEPAQ